MGWIVFAIAQTLVIMAGIQGERRAGRWQWSKFGFALAFAALECALLLTPAFTLDFNNRYFAPVMIAAGIVAAGNFVWFIIACRNWRLPDGRTSIQAYRDDQAALRQRK
jgi:hypothetical protein